MILKVRQTCYAGKVINLITGQKTQVIKEQRRNRAHIKLPVTERGISKFLAPHFQHTTRHSRFCYVWNILTEMTGYSDISSIKIHRVMKLFCTCYLNRNSKEQFQIFIHNFDKTVKSYLFLKLNPSGLQLYKMRQKRPQTNVIV